MPGLGVLTNEVSAFQGPGLKRFYCITVMNLHNCTDTPFRYKKKFKDEESPSKKPRKFEGENLEVVYIIAKSNVFTII